MFEFQLFKQTTHFEAETLKSRPAKLSPSLAFRPLALNPSLVDFIANGVQTITVKGKGSSLDIAPLTILDSGALQPRKWQLTGNDCSTAAQASGCL